MRKIPLPDGGYDIAAVLHELGAEDVPSGHGWKRMRCYAHDDRSPSAAVNRDLNGYVCHSCGLSGDALKLLREEEGLDFAGAVKRAEEITGSSGGSVRESAGWGSVTLLD